MFNFMRNCQIIFPKELNHFVFPPRKVGVSQGPHVLISTWYCLGHFFLVLPLSRPSPLVARLLLLQLSAKFEVVKEAGSLLPRALELFPRPWPPPSPSASTARLPSICGGSSSLLPRGGQPLMVLVQDPQPRTGFCASPRQRDFFSPTGNKAWSLRESSLGPWKPQDLLALS